MRIACLQLNGDRPVDQNVQRALEAIHQLCQHDRPDLLVLPEFFNTFYFPQDRNLEHLNLAEPEDGPSLSALRQVAQQYSINLVAPIFELAAPGLYFDTAFLIGRQGQILGRYRKVHPAAITSLEKIYFRYGSDFPVFDLEGWKVGMGICYDQFFPETARSLAINGAELLVFPFAGGTFSMWTELHRIRAWENLCYLAVCDKVGPEGSWVFGGKSLIVDPLGTVLALASETTEETISATIDRQKVFEARQKFPMYRDRQPWAYQALTRPH